MRSGGRVRLSRCGRIAGKGASEDESGLGFRGPFYPHSNTVLYYYYYYSSIFLLYT